MRPGHSYTEAHQAEAETVKRSYIKRTKPPRARGKRMFKGPEYEDPEYLKKIEALPCTVFTTYGCMGDVIAHHDPTKACGGKDRGNTTPLCWLHHREIHAPFVGGRKTFDKKYGVNLRELGPILAERLTEEAA